ncbi:mitochondrial carrier domain-containing protein [Tribonema minus]|uniref:Mitochondrial carrier domain-containing protein n=1 Tax=Tribonema minus TaxID=303371 RepID=A0A835Z780_9STRA|nr:mitochondrial carrier domain-containing protein [Tribonema minus]
MHGGAGHGAYRNYESAPPVTTVVASIYNGAGVGGFWQGIRPSLARQVLCCGARFAAYDPLKKRICAATPATAAAAARGGAGANAPPALWQMCLAGGGAGAIMGVVGCPADLLKTRAQSGLGAQQRSGARAQGLYASLRAIVQQEGVLALWRGVVPMVQRSAFVSMAELAVYDSAKHWLADTPLVPPGAPTHAAASIAAGFAAAVVGTPIDLAKNRLMVDGMQGEGLRPQYTGMLDVLRKYTGMLDVLRKSAQQDGLRSLYKGFLPTWMRIGPWAIVMFMTYEQLMLSVDALSERAEHTKTSIRLSTDSLSTQA